MQPPQQQINTFPQRKTNLTQYLWQHPNISHSKFLMDNYQQLLMVNYQQQQLLTDNCHPRLIMVNYQSQQQLPPMDNSHQLQQQHMGNYHQMHMVKWQQPLNNIQLDGNKYTHQLQVMFNNHNSNNNNPSKQTKDQDRVPNINDDINTRLFKIIINCS